MKNSRKKLLKFLKWTAIVVFGYWFLSTLIFGHTNLNSKTGIQSFGWSGFDALFSNQEFGVFINEEYKTNLDGVDGPYIFDTIKFSVTENNELKKETFKRNNAIKVHVKNSDKDKFKVKLKNSYEREIDNYKLPNKLIAISDVEGNFNALYSFLVNNNVIDKNYNWIFGNGHLVLNGDFFDRGTNVTQVLWLIYALEEKAEKQGGKVHFINGNHEIINLQGNVSYAQHKYIEVAKQISKEKRWDESAQFLYSSKSELGKWLRTKNVVEKIGNYIFVHGGLNIKHVEQNLTITDINKIAQKYYGKIFKKTPENSKESYVISSAYSPYWDRSLAMNFLYKTIFFLNNSKSVETSEVELDKILNFYDAKKIVIGHSVVNKVSFDYNKKVIKIDVKHGSEKNGSKTQGLLIEDDIEYRIDGLGKKQKL